MHGIRILTVKRLFFLSLFIFSFIFQLKVFATSEILGKVPRSVSLTRERRELPMFLQLWVARVFLVLDLSVAHADANTHVGDDIPQFSHSAHVKSHGSHTPVSFQDTVDLAHQLELHSFKSLLTSLETSMDVHGITPLKKKQKAHPQSYLPVLSNSEKDNSLDELMAQSNHLETTSLSNFVNSISVQAGVEQVPLEQSQNLANLEVQQGYSKLTDSFAYRTIGSTHVSESTSGAGSPGVVALASVIGPTGFSHASTGIPTSQATEAVRTYVEAFYKEQIQVAGVTSEMKTIESVSTGSGAIGWEISRAEDHWPTLARLNSPANGDEMIPLIKSETLDFWSRFLGITQSDTQGLMLVKVASGWQVEFPQASSELNTTHSAKQTLYLSLDGNYRGREPNSDGGTIAFFNVQAGFNLLFVSLKPSQPHLTSDLEGAVAVPVLPGILTYVDLTQFAVRTVEGKVAIKGKATQTEDSLEHESVSVQSGTVRILGAQSAVSKLDQQRTFKIENVLTFSNYPNYLEVDAVEDLGDSSPPTLGFTHRYAILPSEMHHLNLVRNSYSKIQNWLSQTSQPFQDHEGFAIAYLSRLMGAHDTSALTPVIQPVQGSEKFKVEYSYGGATPYPIASDDRIQLPEESRWMDGLPVSLSYALTPDEKRVLGAGFSEGLMEMKVLDDQKKEVWSTIFSCVTPSGQCSQALLESIETRK